MRLPGGSGRFLRALSSKLGPRWLPFADAASPELPLPRLLRLSCFQLTVGMAFALLAGTLNRVMIVELGVSAGLVAGMLALPFLLALLRPLIGHRSDTLRSVLGWRRVPFMWFGALLQFGGFALMPFALLLLEAGRQGSALPGLLGAALSFLMVGVGAHTVQTSGLALATDLAPEEKRPRVVAMLYLMLLVGMVLSALAFSLLLSDFGYERLIQVVQGTAVVTLVLNGVALWKQEPRGGAADAEDSGPGGSFREAWREVTADPRSVRLLAAVALGASGFSMQEVLLEPYGGEVAGLDVAGTSLLTALMAGGAIVAFWFSARSLGSGGDPLRGAGYGALAGTFGFAALILAWPLGSSPLLHLGAAAVGFGGGLFGVGTLVAAMELHGSHRNGLVMGAWGAVQALGTGLAIGLGGLIRDLVADAAVAGHLGPAVTSPVAGYVVVYHMEILALFAAMAAVGPLAARIRSTRPSAGGRLGLADLPL